MSRSCIRHEQDVGLFACAYNDIRMTLGVLGFTGNVCLSVAMKNVRVLSGNIVGISTNVDLVIAKVNRHMECLCYC